MDLRDVEPGTIFNVVVKPIFFDAAHEAHVLEDISSGRRFSYRGLLELGYMRHTLFSVQFLKQYPYPKVQATKDTKILDHEVPTWHSLRTNIDACSGLGALAHGALVAGFHSAVSVDSNLKMVNLCANNACGECIHGDIGDDSTLFEIWKHGRYAKSMTAGFSCQPFSNLGDGRSGLDPRASSLPKVLRAAHLLQIQILTLECVQPAAKDEYVKDEIRKFQQRTGFHCRQIDLSLQNVWPTRRDRAWWVLSSPMVGPIDIDAMPCLNNIDTVKDLIPKIFPWSSEDEHALSLNDVELEGFGVHSDSFHKYLLNLQGKSPCALHSWGNQLVPCACGCRASGLAAWRIQQKGLFGLDCLSATVRGTYVMHIRMRS